MKKIFLLVFVFLILSGCKGVAVTLEEEREYCKSIGMIFVDDSSRPSEIENTKCAYVEEYCSEQCSTLYEYACDEDTFFISRCFDQCILNTKN